MNILLTVMAIVLCFGGVVLADKFFGKDGLYAFMIFATLVANIIVCKTVSMAGVTFTLGAVMFASNFLATDVLSEKYGKKAAKKGVYMAVCAAVLFIVAMQVSLLYKPDATDIANEYMKGLFGLSTRTAIASVALFGLSNLADVYLYDAIRKRVPKKLWLRNNVATITTNCLENFFFYVIAFAGIFDMKSLVEMAVTCSILEAIVGICDTPFIYAATRVKGDKKWHYANLKGCRPKSEKNVGVEAE